MVDAERLRRILQGVAADAARLRDYASIPTESLRADETRMGHVKYLFVTAIEGCINAAHHIGAAEGFEVPSTNADSIRILARRGLLDHELAESIAAAVGFRNVLVHQYLTVDDGIVIQQIAHARDLNRYVAALTKLL